GRDRHRGASAADVVARGSDDAGAPRAADGAPTWPLPPSAVETLVSSGACDGVPVVVDDHTLVYRHVDRAGIDLRVRDLATGADRPLTSSPDLDEMSPQPAIGERAVIALLRARLASGAGPARIDVDRGAITGLPGAAGIGFGPGEITAGGAQYYVLSGTQFMELRDGVATERATFPDGIASFTIDRAARVALLFTGDGACTVDLRAPAAPRCLTDLHGAYGQPGLDDAGRIYYAGDDGLRRRDPASGDDVLIAAGRGANGGLAVSPAGDALFFSECQPQISITRTDDGTVVHTESLTRAQVNRDGAWVFIREEPVASRLAFLDTDGLLHVLTQASQGTATEPALAPTGDLIVFDLVGPEPGLYLTTGRGHRPLRRISPKALGGAVWIDEHHVAATLADEHGVPYVHRVDLDTGEDQRALPLPRWTLDRQPDGDTILLASDDRARLFLWDPMHGREREVALPPELANRQILDADLTAGARAVVLRIGQQEWTLPLRPPGPPRRTYAPPEGKSFWGYEVGADDRAYVLLGEDRGELYRVRLPPGR
ncbi:MAG TPA: hypothetical protein VHE35_20955, partial [Kofleriaceae bacterium]|nr:hypothetical protein [Kofleriaceae bacterium]